MTKLEKGTIVYYFDGENGVQQDVIETHDAELNMYLLTDHGNWFDPASLFTSKRKCRETH